MATVDAPSHAATALHQLVVFSLRGEEYALPIAQVQEIIRYTEPRSVAAELPWMRGVISLRGKIIAVCDLACRLGLDGGDERGGGGRSIVVVETGGDTAGVIVDEVEEVLSVDEAQLDPAPAGGTDLVQAVVRVDDRLIVLLDADGIFAGLATP